MRYLDVSLPLHSDIPTWPGDLAFKLDRRLAIQQGDVANVSQIHCSVHSGTHVDAPLHFIEGGDSVDILDLNTLIGPVRVYYLPGIDAVSKPDLEKLRIPLGTERLLLRTRNSSYWTNQNKSFTTDYVALTSCASEWIVERGIRLIGIDYLSIQRFYDSPLTHQILLEAGVIIVEGLELSQVDPGLYNLICLPLNLIGCDGAPARVVLQSNGDQEV